MKLLSYSQARGLAESMWGTGGTNDYRTNRDGAFYFSCSGHGGFVIDDGAFTEQERKNLAEAGFTADSCQGLRDAGGQVTAVSHPHAQSGPAAMTGQPGPGERADDDIRVWVFEEDCDWAAVYALTGIRTPEAWAGRRTEDEVIAAALESLARWYPQAAAVAARIPQAAGPPARPPAATPQARRRPADPGRPGAARKR